MWRRIFGIIKFYDSILTESPEKLRYFFEKDFTIDSTFTNENLRKSVNRIISLKDDLFAVSCHS